MKHAEVRISPDGRNVAIRDSDDVTFRPNRRRFHHWRSTGGQFYNDEQVKDWLTMEILSIPVEENS